MNWISVKEKLPPNSHKVFITDGRDISCAHWFDKFAGRPNDPGEWVNQHERITGGYINSPTHWAAIEDWLNETRKALEWDIDNFPFNQYDKIQLTDDLLTEDVNGTSVRVPEGATGKVVSIDYADAEFPYEVELYYDGDTEFFDGFHAWTNPKILKQIADEE